MRRRRVHAVEEHEKAEAVLDVIHGRQQLRPVRVYLLEGRGERGVVGRLQVFCKRRALFDVDGLLKHQLLHLLGEQL